jgi:hypothetical protein
MTTPLPMTRGRRLALGIGVPLALILIGWTAVNEVAFAGIGSNPVRLDVPVHSGALRLGVGSADVRFTQAAGEQIRLTGKATYSIVRPTLTWKTSPAGVTLYPDCRFPTGVCGFALTAVLPAGLPLTIGDGDGNMTLQGLSGRVTASDNSGNILGSALSGTADLQAGSGDIRIGGLTSADVTASDNSGNVTLTFAKVPDRVVVSAGSGDVTLVLPPGPTLYHITAIASDGTSATHHVPASSASRHVIHVTDGSGNISITN